MRIMPLHNIRQAGFIPNSYQKEEAPPPTPDPSMQPDMRIKAYPMTDTRHAIEYFNPLARMETNPANPSNPSYPGSVEMGRDRERSDEKDHAGKGTWKISDYERLLELIREKRTFWASKMQEEEMKAAIHLSSDGEAVNNLQDKNNFLDVDTADTKEAWPSSVRNPFVASNATPALAGNPFGGSALSPSPQMTKSNENKDAEQNRQPLRDNRGDRSNIDIDNYYFLRGQEAYRKIQSFFIQE